MSIDLSQFHATFLEESLEGLQIMESSLLSMNAGGTDEDTINNIFRAAHSIKGGSATFGFENVASFTHILETLLDELRSGKRSVDQKLINLLLESVDCVRAMLSSASGEIDYDESLVISVKQRLEAVLLNTSATPTPEDNPTGQEMAINGWEISFKPHQGMLQTGNDPYRIIRELQSLGPVDVDVDYSHVPDIETLEAESIYLSWQLSLHGDIDKNEVLEIFEWVEDECELELTPIAIGDAVTQENNPSADQDVVESLLATTASASQQDNVSNDMKVTQPASVKPKKTAEGGSSIRVAIDKVDELINMVGELVITQSMLGQLGDDFDMSKIEKLKDGLGQLERNTRELQESVMRIRMLPISFVFNRFPRLVHDLSAKLDKQVELKFTGEQTELDKTVMEKIGDPLVHLIRNSLDHGLETPDVRVENGKPAVGMLHLNAYHKGGSIVIEIIDDGAGLNKEKILQKAISSGLITESETLSDDKIHDLIFQPGFSTAEVVSDVSGRGVGMDVVRRNIRELGGTVDIKSKSGVGSTITIRLPLTLAIMDGQLVRVGQETYIIPIVSIIESLQVKQDCVNRIVDRAEVYKLREEYINISRLYQIFDLVPDTEDINNGLLVVVEGDGVKVGLFVDELLGQQQVVIKSLESNYQRIDGVSGATILGDGTVAMILDVPGLIALFQESSKKSVDQVA